MPRDKKKLILAVALLGLRERCDRRAESLEKAGNTKQAERLDRLAHKIQRALDEDPEVTSELSKGELVDVLESLLDINEEEQEILSDALGGEEGVEALEEGELATGEGDGDEFIPEEGGEPKEEETLTASKKAVDSPTKPNAKTPATPARKAYRVQSVRG